MAEPTKKNTEVKAAEAPSGSATGFRIGAVVLWLVAIGFEVVALLTVFKKMFPSVSPTVRIVLMIVFLVLDLAALIAGSALWKRSNKIDPASEKNKLKFWLWNNLGVIVAAFAFIPFIILVLLNKDTDKKTKTIAVVVAVIALLIGGLASYDFSPLSAEQKAAAMEHIKGEVYSSKEGDVYHLPDCNYIREGNRLDGEIRENVTKYADVEASINAGHYRLCKVCAKRHELDQYNILTNEDKAADTGDTAEIVTDDAPVTTGEAE